MLDNLDGYEDPLAGIEATLNVSATSSSVQPNIFDFPVNGNKRLNYQSVDSPFRLEMVDGCFQCSICQKKLKNKASFSRHVKDQHLPVAPVNCDLCGKEFKNKNCMTSHKSTAHRAHKYLESYKSQTDTEEKQLEYQRKLLEKRQSLHSIFDSV